MLWVLLSQDGSSARASSDGKLPVLSRLLGHSRDRMALHYARVGDRETEAAAERIGSAVADLIGVSAP